MKSDTLTSPADLASIVESASSTKRSRRSLWIILALIAVGTAVLPLFLGKSSENTVHYVTENLQRGHLKLDVTATGNLEPTNEVTIGSEMSGITAEVLVDVNDRIKKGQELARITVRRLEQDIQSSRAAVNAANAKVNQVKATLVENEATLSRLEELHRLSGGKTPSKADMITAQATVTRAKADLGSAEASVEQAKSTLQANEYDQAKSVLRSPIDGIVLTRTLEPGLTVVASFNAPELFVIAENLEHMKLRIAVAEADIGHVKAGQDASFSVDAWPDRTYNAKVTRVSFGSAVTDNVVTYEAELEVENQDLSLRPGMTATADIRVAERMNVLLVPNSALRFNPEAANATSAKPRKSFVQSLMPGPPRRAAKAKTVPSTEPVKPEAHKVWILRDGKPVAIPVKLGLSDGRMTEISGEGLLENQSIILRIDSTE
jgi:HlyD family secretion protein